MARAKSDLYLQLSKNKGVVFVNGADEYLMRMGARFESPLYYSHPEAFYPIDFLGANPFVTYKTSNGKVWETSMIGEYNFNNIAATLAVGFFFDVNEEQMNEALVGYISDNNRSEVRKVGTNTVILDAYNANPSSMRSAITTFSKMDVDKKIVMLGDMFELGTTSAQEHQEIAALSSGDLIDETFLCGEQFFQVQEVSAHKFMKTKELEEYLKLHKIENTHILIKGSRGMKMEFLVDYLG